jgi:RNA-directed DNA polymerase
MEVKAAMTERLINLVLPLDHKSTAMHTTDTSDSNHVRSGAVSSLIGKSLRAGDVDSKKLTCSALATPGFRTSTMAIRTTGTSTTTTELGQFANQYEHRHAEVSFEDLVKAYFDCRKNKRNTKSALEFEQNLETNLCDLYDELISGSYKPGKSICFVITHPKPREVWAADFRDRVVHHLMYNQISPIFYPSFIADSCACIPGRGTLYGAKRLESKVRSITQNWSKPAHYLKLDLANFFVSINKDILATLLAKKIPQGFWLDLTKQILFHDPRADFEFQGHPSSIELVPHYKRLTSHPAHLGLPIGNLSSQFFANIYMNELDQFVKHQIGARHYIRYVDDMVLLHESAQWLNNAKDRIEQFLAKRLDAKINPKKTILQPVERGVDFVGQVIKPWRNCSRRKNVYIAINAISRASESKFSAIANSYLGLLGQAKSHRDRARVSKVILRHGRSINKQFTKTHSSQRTA